MGNSHSTGVSVSKGSGRRGADAKSRKAYETNWDRIFRPALPEYPHWTCSSCATKYGGHFPEGHRATFHSGICPVCGLKKALTEPRDYGFPDFCKTKNRH